MIGIRRDGSPHSTQARQIAWWYLSALAATLYFKYEYLDTVFLEGFGVLVRNIAPGESILAHALYTVLFFTGDAVEVLLGIALVFVLGRRLLRIPLRALIVVSNSITLLVAAANRISIAQLRTLTSIDSLETSLRWLQGHPELLATYFSAGTLLGAVLGLVWAVSPLWGFALSERFDLLPAWRPRIPAALFVAVALCGLTWAVSTRLAFDKVPLPLRGYWSSSLLTFLGESGQDLAKLTIPPVAALAEEYAALAFPASHGDHPDLVAGLRADAPRPRHLLIVSLETAPLRYYPIASDPAFETFHAMSRRAIVSDRHYTNTPFTTRANYTMLTGTYPPPGGAFVRWGEFVTDGLATVLGRRGFRTTYIDSMKLEWHPGQGNHELIRYLGFENVIDRSGFPTDFSFEATLEAERHSFEHALGAIEQAIEEGRPSLVFIGTIFGHYRWRSRPEDAELPAARKIHKIAMEFDRLLGEALTRFDELGIGEEVIVLVTGDHGLRYGWEFESLDLAPSHSDVAFNVPFLLYAPGLLETRIDLPHVTSHIDITPTLLSMVGVPTEGLLHHGAHLLDRRNAGRVTFMMNSGLSPTDGFHWSGLFVTHNSLSGVAELAQTPDRADRRLLGPDAPGYSRLEPVLRDPRAFLERANHLLDLTLGTFLLRARGETATGERPG